MIKIHYSTVHVESWAFCRAFINLFIRYDTQSLLFTKFLYTYIFTTHFCALLLETKTFLKNKFLFQIHVHKRWWTLTILGKVVSLSFKNEQKVLCKWSKIILGFYFISHRMMSHYRGFFLNFTALCGDPRSVSWWPHRSGWPIAAWRSDHWSQWSWYDLCYTCSGNINAI